MDCIVSHLDVQGVDISIRVDGYPTEPCLSGGLQHPHGNLTAVRDQHRAEGSRSVVQGS